MVRNLKVMARMGVYFQQHVQQRYPEFPVRTGRLSWEDYLPAIERRAEAWLECTILSCREVRVESLLHVIEQADRSA